MAPQIEVYLPKIFINHSKQEPPTQWIIWQWNFGDLELKTSRQHTFKLWLHQWVNILKIWFFLCLQWITHSSRATKNSILHFFCHSLSSWTPFYQRTLINWKGQALCEVFVEVARVKAREAYPPREISCFSYDYKNVEDEVSCGCQGQLQIRTILLESCVWCFSTFDTVHERYTVWEDQWHSGSVIKTVYPLLGGRLLYLFISGQMIWSFNACMEEGEELIKTNPKWKRSEDG